MDSLALPKTVTLNKDGDGAVIPDLDKRVKELIRGQQKKKARGTKTVIVASPDIPRLLATDTDATLEHVEPYILPKSTGAPITFRCHACGELCIDTVPYMYPLSTTTGRDLIGHVPCLYRYGLTRRHVLRDNGLVTLMLAGSLGPLTRIKSAFVFRSLPSPSQTQDSFITT